MQITKNSVNISNNTATPSTINRVVFEGSSMLLPDCNNSKDSEVVDVVSFGVVSLSVVATLVVLVVVVERMLLGETEKSIKTRGLWITPTQSSCSPTFKESASLVLAGLPLMARAVALSETSLRKPGGNIAWNWTEYSVDILPECGQDPLNGKGVTRKNENALLFKLTACITAFKNVLVNTSMLLDSNDDDCCNADGVAPSRKVSATVSTP